MLFRHVALLVGGLVVLGGCQNQKVPHTAGIAVDAIKASYIEPDCRSGSCAEVDINALRFPDSPALTEQLRQTLLSMGMGISDGENDQPARSWEAFAQQFFMQAKADREFVTQSSASQALLEAKVYARYNDLLVIELDSYVYHTGQAHGMPFTQFMVIDERLERVVSLDDMLVEGQEAAFNEALTQAHRRWLTQTEAGDDFVANWPFRESHNVAPLETDWIVRYNVYDIAPYSAGQPELHIPDDTLVGIVEPRYLEH